MLNRRATNYIFYGILVGVIGLVILARFLLLGSINDINADTHQENISLQNQITDLEILVAENRDKQTEDLYLLFDQIPNSYSYESLENKTRAIFEKLGIDESDDYQRFIQIDDDPVIPADSVLEQYSASYKLVEVMVFFSSNESGLIPDMLDAIYENNQLFIVTNLNFDVGLGFDYTGTTVRFLAIYNID